MTSVKRIIGLTGNIATGKSVVRRMLVNHGALGIDADVIAHRVLYPGGTAYKPVIEAFGDQILSPTGEIIRGKIGEIVFSSPEHLQQLEKLTHPAVTDAIQTRMDTTNLPMVVIEAIKLLESSLVNLFDSLWVSHVAEEEQLTRLIETRNLSVDAARQRIDAQPPQSEKLSCAKVVIHTAGTFESTWRQIHTALNDTIHLIQTFETPHINISNNWWIQPIGTLPPSQLSMFFGLHPGHQPDDLYQWLAFKVLTPVMSEQGFGQLLVWDGSNFIAKLEQIIPGQASQEQATMALVAFEAHARANQSELLIIPSRVAQQLDKPLDEHGFKHPTDEMDYPDWQQALSDERDPWIKVLSQPLESTNTNTFD